MNFVVMGPVSQNPMLIPLPPMELAEMLGDVVCGSAGKLVAVGTRVCRMLLSLQIKATDLITRAPIMSKEDIILSLQVSQCSDGSELVEWEAFKCSPAATSSIH